MNRRQKPPQPRHQNPAYRPAFDRLDVALEENATRDNREKIRRMREAYFADVDALQKSGKVIIPE